MTDIAVGQSNLSVDRSTTIWIRPDLSDNQADGAPFESTKRDQSVRGNDVAKVRVAGSNPVVRSKESPGQSA